MTMTIKFDKFYKALNLLCVEHVVDLVASDDDDKGLVVYDRDPISPYPPIEYLEDCTKDKEI